MKKRIVIFILLSLALVVFGQDYTLTVSSMIIGGGDGATIRITPPGEIITGSITYTFTAGESVYLEALNGDIGTGYCPPHAMFTQWDGDWTGDTEINTGTLIMDQNRSVTAYFERIYVPCPPPTVTTFYISSQTAAVGEEIVVPVDYRFEAMSGGNSNPKATLHYDPEMFELVLSRGDNGFDGGYEAAEYVEPGTINLSVGISGMGTTLPFGIFYFKALKPGTTNLSITDPIPDNINFITSLSIPFTITRSGTTGQPGAFYLDQPEYTVTPGDTFTTSLLVNTGTQKVASFGVTLNFNPVYLSLDSSTGGNAGMVLSGNIVSPGTFLLSGFDTEGKGPSPNIELAILNWSALLENPATPLIITPDILTDEAYQTIGTPVGINSRVTIKAKLCGDINGDGVVNIVDALMIAQYYVQIIPPGDLDLSVADVNCSGALEIVDALMIAQYAVGLGVTLTCC